MTCLTRGCKQLFWRLLTCRTVGHLLVSLELTPAFCRLVSGYLTNFLPFTVAEDQMALPKIKSAVRTSHVAHNAARLHLQWLSHLFFLESLALKVQFSSCAACLSVLGCAPCAGGENGFNQAIELSADTLSNVKFVQEKRLISKFFDEISQDTGKIVFGIKDTLTCLEMGAVETLIVYEDLAVDRVTILNPSTGENYAKFAFILPHLLACLLPAAMTRICYGSTIESGRSICITIHGDTKLFSVCKGNCQSWHMVFWLAFLAVSMLIFMGSLSCRRVRCEVPDQGAAG